MNYFIYLSMTGKDDTDENFYEYLVNVMGWTETSAKSFVYNLKWEKE